MERGCGGACNQGRKSCPTPFACELAEKVERDGYEKAVENLVMTLMVFVIACCSYVIWSLLS